MLVIENASVICRSVGEKNICIVQNENTGEQISLENVNGMDLELGMEGKITYTNQPEKQLIAFEPVMEEELAL